MEDRDPLRETSRKRVREDCVRCYERPPVVPALTWRVALTPLTAPVPRTLEPGPLSGAMTFPAPGEAPHVWLLRASVHASTLPDSLGLLDAGEYQRYKSFMRDVDRTSYGAAHVGLRRLLGGYLGRGPGELTFVRETCPTCGGPHGRPALKGEDRTHFSLSHSGDLVLFAFAGTPVGADVEKVPGQGSVDDVSTNLHVREQKELAALDPEERRTAFVRCWARKEAYLKGTGEGMSGGLARDYLGTGETPVDLPGWELMDCQVDPGYGAAIAVAIAG